MKTDDYTKERSLKFSTEREDILREELQQEKKERRFIIILISTGLILSIVLSIVTYNLINRSVLNQGKDLSGQVLGEEEETEDIQFAPIDKIAYIYFGNIWVYDLEGRENVQLTTDGDTNYSYTSLAWRNREELSYAKCEFEKCILQTYSFEESRVIDEFEIETSQVPAIRWSHKGDVLAYLFMDDEQLYLTIKSEGVYKNLGKFPYLYNYGIYDYSDALYIRFSPSDERIMILNTFVREGEASLVVLEQSGEEVLSLERTRDSFPTFGFFMSDDTVYYKKGEYLYVRSLETAEETEVTTRIVGAFNFQPSPDRTVISYWTHDWISGITTIWTYEVGTETMKRIRDQNSLPAWIDNKTLISVATSDCKMCARDKLEFTGFNNVDLETKVVTSLIELEDITFFTVDNF